MSKKLKKQQRELAIRAEKAKRENERLARTPLNKEQMLALYSYVGSCIVENCHERNFAITDGWLSDNGFELSSVHQFLLGLEVGDDWALLMNGDPFSLFGSSSTRHIWMPLEEIDLENLINYLEDELEEVGCNHTFKLTESWLLNTEYDISLVKAALLAQGGGCDCEVMYNVEPEGIYV
jgi:hypothetical protein